MRFGFRGVRSLSAIALAGTLLFSAAPGAAAATAAHRGVTNDDIPYLTNYLNIYYNVNSACRAVNPPGAIYGFQLTSVSTYWVYEYGNTAAYTATVYSHLGGRSCDNRDLVGYNESFSLTPPYSAGSPWRHNFNYNYVVAWDGNAYISSYVYAKWTWSHTIDRDHRASGTECTTFVFFGSAPCY